MSLEPMPHLRGNNFHTPIHDGHHGNGQNPDIHPGRDLATYEGYLFTRAKSIPGSSKLPNWHRVDRVRIPVAEDDLRTRVEKQYSKGVTGEMKLRESNMNGYKREQVISLVNEKCMTETDPGSKWVVACITLDLDPWNKKISHAMHVILKREHGRRNGNSASPMLYGTPQSQTGKTVDLGNPGNIEEESLGDSPNGLFDPWDTPLPIQQGNPRTENGQHGTQMFDHRKGPAPHGHGTDSHFLRSHDQHSQDRLRVHDFHPHHGEKDKKPKNKKHRPPPIIHGQANRGRHGSYESDDSDLTSDISGWSGNESIRTPDTAVSSHSSHRKDYKYAKRRSDSHRGSHGHENDDEPHHNVYRRHQRKTSSRGSGSRYLEDEVDILPEDHRRSGEPKRIPSYVRERPALRSNHLGYDDRHHFEEDIGRMPGMIRRQSSPLRHREPRYEHEVERHDRHDRHDVHHLSPGELQAEQLRFMERSRPGREDVFHGSSGGRDDTFREPPRARRERAHEYYD